MIGCIEYECKSGRVLFWLGLALIHNAPSHGPMFLQCSLRLSSCRQSHRPVSCFSCIAHPFWRSRFGVDILAGPCRACFWCTFSPVLHFAWTFLLARVGLVLVCMFCMLCRHSRRPALGSFSRARFVFCAGILAGPHRAHFCMHVLCFTWAFSPAHVRLVFGACSLLFCVPCGHSRWPMSGLFLHAHSRSFHILHAHFCALIFVWMFLSKSVYGFTLHR
jgi:hypothetical protein